MRGALCITETSNSFGKNLDAARRRHKRMGARIVSEILEQDEFGIRRGDFDKAGFPEAVEIG